MNKYIEIEVSEEEFEDIGSKGIQVLSDIRLDRKYVLVGQAGIKPQHVDTLGVKGSNKFYIRPELKKRTKHN